MTGRTIEQVRSVDKHLLMQFSGGLLLHTHMRMSGSWHIYRPGERWRRSVRDMRILLATADFEAVGFNIHVAEFIAEKDLARYEALSRLGPDLLSGNFDRTEAIRRLREQAAIPIADALLKQSVLAGLGKRVGLFVFIELVGEKCE